MKFFGQFNSSDEQKRRFCIISCSRNSLSGPIVPDMAAPRVRVTAVYQPQRTKCPRGGAGRRRYMTSTDPLLTGQITASLSPASISPCLPPRLPTGRSGSAAVGHVDRRGTVERRYSPISGMTGRSPPTDWPVRPVPSRIMTQLGQNRPHRLTLRRPTAADM